MARRELEIRIKVPHDDDRKYIHAIYLKALKAYVEYLEDCGDNVPQTGNHFVDEAVVWWCSREIL